MILSLNQGTREVTWHMPCPAQKGSLAPQHRTTPQNPQTWMLLHRGMQAFGPVSLPESCSQL